jgi:hypothetical protein
MTVPESDVETVTVRTDDEWDFALTRYRAAGWHLESIKLFADGTKRMTFVPDQGEAA